MIGCSVNMIVSLTVTQTSAHVFREYWYIMYQNYCTICPTLRNFVWKLLKTDGFTYDMWLRQLDVVIVNKWRIVSGPGSKSGADCRWWDIPTA